MRDCHRRISGPRAILRFMRNSRAGRRRRNALVLSASLAASGAAHAAGVCRDMSSSRMGEAARAAVARMAAGETSDPLKNSGLLVMSTEKVGQSAMQASIFTVRADGTGKRVLTGAGNYMPSWTPFGEIIFVSARTGAPQVWIMNEDGTNARQIGSIPDGPAQPQMARNGLIVFGSNSGIWSMRQDGDELKRLVSHTADVTVAHPSLALSGAWLTYTSYERVPNSNIPLHRQIWRIDIDGTGNRQMTFPNDPDYPDGNASMISPDEKWIAVFTGKEDEPGQTLFTTGHRNVGVMSAEGGAIRLLTDCRPVRNRQEFDARGESECIMADDPAWTPDSKRVIHSRANKHFSPLGTWMIDMNGHDASLLHSELRGFGRVPMR